MWVKLAKEKKYSIDHAIVFIGNKSHRTIKNQKYVQTLRGLTHTIKF